MKHVAKFTKFLNEAEAEQLTKGERAAIARGEDLLTDAQAAVCYLYAKDLSYKLFSTGKGSVVSDTVSPSEKMDVADNMGLKAASFTRAVRKFKIMLGKEEQGEEALYPKLEKLFNHFEDMTTDQLVDLGKSAFTEDAKLKGEDYRQQRLDKQAKEKQRDAKLVQDVKDVYKGLYNYFVNVKKLSTAESKKKVVDQVAKKFSITNKEVLEIIG
jgi:hypothetical protein